MVGVLVTAVFSAVAALAGHFLLSRWTGGLDPAEKLGLAGLVGLGLAGLVTLFAGLTLHGPYWALFVVPLLALVGAVFFFVRGGSRELRFEFPRSFGLLGLTGLIVVGLLALLAVLAPSVATDWDTIAYHLAVPKLWLMHGRIDYIAGIHHSNFPSTMEMLFMLGLQWGGQSGAKAFSLVVFVFGCLALFGVARRWYGGSAGWWAALAFAGIPVVAWESGTGYIDVAHGLFCALGAVYAVEYFRKEGSRDSLVLSGICLGFALGTKYTGLQMLFATLFVVVLAVLLARGFKDAVRVKLTVLVIALLIGGAWYVKTAVMTGNPVYPFFYSVLGGRDWDEWRSAIYTDEQKSFGVGSSLGSVGHAVLGLGYQPGRYTNPGPTQGQGFPTGAIGFACLLGGIAAAVSGRLRREERLLLAIVGLQFLMWFVLSQQSRYLTMLAIPMGLLGAGMVSRVKWGPVVAGGFAVQAVYSVWMINTTQTQMQLQVVSGKVTQDQYLTQLMSPFYPATKRMNELPSGSKVALYDEVFGFYLDVPYFWANPGHSTLIPYLELKDGQELAAKMKDLGFTHVYVNLRAGGERFAQALAGNELYTAEEWEELGSDPNHRWKLLLADAANKGLVRDVAEYEGAALGELVR